MRIRITLELTNKKIPVKYHSYIQGIIYHALPQNEVTTALHDKGMVVEKRKFKLYTFSEIYGPTKYIKEEQQLLFSDNGYFDIAAFDETIINQLMDFFLSNNKIIFNNQIINVLSYNIVREYTSNETIGTFTTISPVLAYKTENKKINYLEPLSDEFKESIINNISKKYYGCYDENIENLEITNITNIKKKIVYFRNVFYIAYHLEITFDNLTPKIRKVILSSGIGSKNSMGFGMVNEK